MQSRPEAAKSMKASLPMRIAAFGGIFFSMGAFNQFLSGGKSAGFDNAQLMLFFCYFFGLYSLVVSLRGVRIHAAPRGLFLYLSYCLLSVVWAGFAQIVFLKATFYVLAAFFAFYLAVRFERNEVAAMAFWAFLAGVTASALFALLVPDEGVHREYYILGLWKGIFVQKNHLGRACVILTNFALLRFAPERRLTCLLAMALSVVVCLLTGSLTSLLLLGYVVFIALLLRWFSARGVLVISAFTAILGVVLIHVLPDLLALLGRDMSLTGRAYVWDACWQAFWDSPVLGKGFNAFWAREFGFLSPLYYSEIWMMADSHNGYLDLLLDLGIVGMLLFAFCVWEVLRETLRSDDGSQARFVVLLLLPLLARNLTESSLNKPTNVEWILFCYLYFQSHGVRFVRNGVWAGQQRTRTSDAELRLL